MGQLLRSTMLESALLRPVILPVAGGSSGGLNDYVINVRVGKPGACGNLPVYFVILFDDSASMLTKSADPCGKRYEEAMLAIETVGRRCKCKPGTHADSVAVYHFDTPTVGDLPVSPIRTKDPTALRSALAVPSNTYGRSELGPALHQAYGAVAGYEQSHHVVLMVMTDWQLFDNFTEDFLNFPGELHTVVFNGSVPQRLIDAGNVTITEVNHTSKPGTVARAVFRGLIAPRVKAKPLELGEALVVAANEAEDRA